MSLPQPEEARSRHPMWIRYERAEEFLPWNSLRHVYGWTLGPHWIGDNHDSFWYRVRSRRGHEYILVDSQACTRALAFDHQRLAAALDRETGDAHEAYRLPLRALRFSRDMRHMSFSDKAISWSCDLDTYTLVPAPDHAGHGETLSPDGHYAAYVREHNLWVRDTNSGRRIQLTTDGEPHRSYACEPEGRITSVGERLSGLTPPPSLAWSPDSTRILTVQVDERSVSPMYLLQHAPLDGAGRPVLHAYRMALATDAVLAEASWVLVDVAARKVTRLDVPPVLCSALTPLAPAEAATTAHLWSRSGRFAYPFVFSRDRRAVCVFEVDADTACGRLLMAEEADVPLSLNEFWLWNPNYRALSGGQELLWFSRRDGWGHLYLYDAGSGTLKRRVTEGEWVVRDILHVDDSARVVTFSANGVDRQEDPYQRHVYRANLDHPGTELLTPEDGDHLAQMSPSGGFIFDTWSRVDAPPASVLRDANGRILMKLESADAADLLAKGFRFPEPFVAKGRDATTDVCGCLWRPSDFDPAHSYPVIDSIYGGPQETRVPHTFPLCLGAPPPDDIEFGAEEYWDPQALAELGFIVVAIDGMGTPYRSTKFSDRAYDPRNAGGLADHVAALREIAATRPWMDLERVGIYGHSAGGDNAVKALIHYSRVFRVAVSSSGNHEMRCYNADWGERILGLDLSAYDAFSNPRHAHSMRGKLLLVTGDMDENVHPACTMQLVNALVEANKDFDLLVLPNRDHDCSLDPYCIRRRWDFFVRHLLGEDPPHEYRIVPGSMNEMLP